MNSNSTTNSPAESTPAWLLTATDAGWEAYTISRAETRKLGPWIDFTSAIKTAVKSAFAQFGGGARWKHLKRGWSYDVIARGELQCSAPIDEGTVLFAYVGDDGKVWFRPAVEFEDGRFVREA